MTSDSELFSTINCLTKSDRFFARSCCAKSFHEDCIYYILLIWWSQKIFNKMRGIENFSINAPKFKLIISVLLKKMTEQLLTVTGSKIATKLTEIFCIQA